MFLQSNGAAMARMMELPHSKKDFFFSFVILLLLASSTSSSEFEREQRGFIRERCAVIPDGVNTHRCCGYATTATTPTTHEPVCCYVCRPLLLLLPGCGQSH